jgi:hypothetical protein
MGSRAKHSIWTRTILTVIVTAGIIPLASCAGWQPFGVNGTTTSACASGNCPVSVWVEDGDINVCPWRIHVAVNAKVPNTITWVSKDKNSYTITFKSTDPLNALGTPGGPYKDGIGYKVVFGTPSQDDKYTIFCSSCGGTVPPLDPHVIIMGPK